MLFLLGQRGDSGLQVLQGLFVAAALRFGRVFASEQFSENPGARRMVFGLHRVIVEHHGLHARALENGEALGVLAVLRNVDENDVGPERKNALGVEDVVVVATDRRETEDRGEGLREELVFARARRLPAVLRERHDFLEGVAASRHEEVEDVVRDDDALGRLFKAHLPSEQIGDGAGGLLGARRGGERKAQGGSRKSQKRGEQLTSAHTSSLIFRSVVGFPVRKERILGD